MASSKVPPGHFTMLYFAAASSFTSKGSEVFPAPISLGELPRLLEERYPGIKDKILASCALTINLDYTDMDESSVVIQAGDEVALIPPVSSG
jgi:molybdopterin synthase sulfur carrier subunit